MNTPFTPVADVSKRLGIPERTVERTLAKALAKIKANGDARLFSSLVYLTHFRKESKC